jgi:endonuclease YncB( thermonuclease family)
MLASASFAVEPYQAKVIGISDGDTIKVLHEGTQVKIRLYGIDTPERRQAFGNKAKQFTATLYSVRSSRSFQWIWIGMVERWY